MQPAGPRPEEDSRPAAAPAGPASARGGAPRPNGGTFGGMVGANLRRARKIVVLVIGSTVLALGAALIVLPGPAFVVIPVGLAILATEFEWARRWLHDLREGARTLVDRDQGPRDLWRRWRARWQRRR